MSRSINAVGALFALLAIQAVIGEPATNRFSRIVGGQLANNGEFGAIVSLSIPGYQLHVCGGSIIGPRHILTAGHCVGGNKPIVVRTGLRDLRDSGNAVERRVTAIYVHPGYIPFIKGRQMLENDLAILVLQQPLPIGGRIQMLKLPIQPPQQGNYVTAGWGRNSPGPTHYQYGLKTLAMSLCSRNLFGFPPNTICAQTQRGNVCSGDSGSPFVQNGYVYGVTSMSSCAVGHPATFVNVYPYVDWIKSILSQ